MGRGRERTIRCAKCGRQTRVDKAVCIEKPILQNPLERKDVMDDQYFTALTKEVCYCASCGKHLRIYDKKIKENIRNQERQQRFGGYGNRPGGQGSGGYGGQGQQGSGQYQQQGGGSNYQRPRY